ncbi:MAG: imidazoleglycerol-phosphate dehydratase HisB [Candidatus Ratteibacteria bacterium]|nr:imidazoleglycerol-phosphate dehydratase HisB [Candidatus Ratteibacteria bacterium]
MKKRKAIVNRVTKETKISLKLNLDGEGKSRIDSGMPFLDHMLTLFSRHSLVDLEIKARGDLKVDYHHTVEDIGICLGEAIRKALGTKEGINRFGSKILPMDESLVSVSIDISNRPLLVFNVPLKAGKSGDFNLELVEEFLKAFASQARITLHFNLVYGRNFHHVAESIFKTLARTLAEAVSLNKRVKGIPSTKGRL